MANVEEKVMAIIAEKLNVSKDKIKPENEFMKDLGADSLEQVELVMEFEDAFSITIPDEMAQKIKTVGEAIQQIKKEVEG